jgi:BASS family bile acid:Na+ symporter
MSKLVFRIGKILWVLALTTLIILVIMLFLGYRSETGPAAIAFGTFLASAFMTHRLLKSFTFTLWVFVFVTASMYYPAAFGSWFGIDLAILIVPLIQIIMFGMGTTLSLADFARVFTLPWPVFIGIILQFSIMPFAGYSIAMLFGFEPEIAAGVILIGSCPGGVASNLMTYLAGGNVALSVTMTSCSTLMSPIMTPFMMKTLAGKLVPINFIAMMLSILNMIIVPIVAGLIANRILYSKNPFFINAKTLSFIALTSIVMAIFFGYTQESLLGSLVVLKGGLILGFALIGIVALAKWVVERVFRGPTNWMDRTLPIVSMAGICYIIAIITARSSEKLLAVGFSLILASIIHNFIGYILGYWFARASRLDEKSSRTVAFEVGMQNGGMASGLAMSVLNSTNAALAPAIFGPWMNVSGSVLATWWHRKPVKKISDPEKLILK